MIRVKLNLFIFSILVLTVGCDVQPDNKRSSTSSANSTESNNTAVARGEDETSYISTDQLKNFAGGPGNKKKNHVSVVCFTSDHDDLIAWRCWQIMVDLDRRGVPYDGPVMDPPKGGKPPVFRNPGDIHLNPTPATCKLAGQNGVDHVVFVGHCTDITGNGEGDVWGNDLPNGGHEVRCSAGEIVVATQEGGASVIWSMCNPDIVPTVPGTDMIWCAEGGGLLDTGKDGNDRWKKICTSIANGRNPGVGRGK